MKSKNEIRTGCLCAVACETLFGFSYLFTKDATEYGSELFLLGWRFFIATVAMGICVATGLVKIDFKGKKLSPLLAVALFSPVLYYIGETFGISHTTASESGSFLACIPVMAMLASSLILKKKPKRIQVIGIIVTFIGVLTTVFAVGVSSSLSIIGYLALIISVFSYALYSVNVEKAVGYTGEEITFVMLLAGMVTFVSLALTESIFLNNTVELLTFPFADSHLLIACIYQGIGCSVIASFLSNVAISKIGVNRASSFLGISTVVSIIAGVLILKEPFSILQVIGVVLIITGVYTANSRINW